MIIMRIIKCDAYIFGDNFDVHDKLDKLKMCN